MKRYLYRCLILFVSLMIVTNVLYGLGYAVYSFVQSVTQVEETRQDRLAVFISDKYKIAQDKAKAIVATVHQLSAEKDIDPDLVLGIIATESSFREDAASKSSRGLMQIHHVNFKWLGIDKETVYDIETNIASGIVVLQGFLERHRGDMDKALRGYSGGAKNYAYKVHKNTATFKAIE